MNVSVQCSPPPTSKALCLLGLVWACGWLPLSLQAQVKRQNPASKVYVSDVAGEASIHQGESSQELSKRSVYHAEGSIIETKRPAQEADRRKSFSTMVYSNGTGVFFDADTRVEVKRFMQEPFTPMRSDMEVEPSISQTHAFIARGAVGLCASKLVAGSSMVYETPHGSVTIRGRKIVIEVDPDVTRISMLEGESTVRAGALDGGGRVLRNGEQAVIRTGAAGQPNSIEITPIPPSEMANLEDRVAMACMATRTVYFEVRDQASGGGGINLITAFDASAGTSSEIIAVPVVPSTLPVQFTISPANL